MWKRERLLMSDRRSRCIKGRDVGDEQIPLSFLGPRIQRRFHRYGYSLLRERYFFSQAVWAGLDHGSPKVFIRVDDFPYFDVSNTEFLRCHKIFEALGIPYVLGVTPFWEFERGNVRELNDEDARILRQCRPLCTVALHGFSHHPYPESSFSDELDHYSDTEVEIHVRRTRSTFEMLGLEFPTALIVPFNTIRKPTFVRFSRYFRYVFGGPAGLSTLGGRSLYDQIGEACYLPSYQPYYGHCRYMLRFFRKGVPVSKECYIPLTIHWGWERADGFKAMKELLSALSERVVSFEEVCAWLRGRFPHC
jgi:hypothetical protein